MPALWHTDGNRYSYCHGAAIAHSYRNIATAANANADRDIFADPSYPNSAASPIGPTTAVALLNERETPCSIRFLESEHLAWSASILRRDPRRAVRFGIS